MVKILSDIFDLFEQTNCITVGSLDSEKISFIKKNCPQIFKKIKNYSIIMWKDRIEHLSKHSYDASRLPIDELVNLIPDIINNPDYIGYREKDSSLQFIKEFENNILVAVRADGKGKLAFRTMYTITAGQLSDYINKDRAWKFNIDSEEK